MPHLRLRFLIRSKINEMFFNLIVSWDRPHRIPGLAEGPLQAAARGAAFVVFVAVATQPTWKENIYNAQRQLRKRPL
jgi:hypothetical protein